MKRREQRTAALLHREGGQGDVAAALSHVLQPARLTALQKLRAARREDDVRHRGDGRLWSGVALEQRLSFVLWQSYRLWSASYVRKTKTKQPTPHCICPCNIACAYILPRDHAPFFNSRFIYIYVYTLLSRSWLLSEWHIEKLRFFSF